MYATRPTAPKYRHAKKPVTEDFLLKKGLQYLICKALETYETDVDSEKLYETIAALHETKSYTLRWAV